MKITFLGTGSSLGVPMVCCECINCRKAIKNKKLQRKRSSILVQFKGKNILIDAGPDLRQQLLENKVKKIDAVLFTHAHFDHIMGLDDLRPFNWLRKKIIPIYATGKHLAKIKKSFHYIFSPKGEPTKPKIKAHSLGKKLELFGLRIQTMKVKHGANGANGFVFGNKKRIAFFPDCREIKEKDLKELTGIELFVLGVPRQKSYKHMNLKDALRLVKKINPKKAIFTHISHSFNTTKAKLPANVKVAFDGMKVRV